MASEQVVLVMVFMMAAVLSMVAVLAARFKKVPEGKAMVVYGRLMDSRSRIGYRIITGKGKFILPIIECFEYLDLEKQKIVLDHRDVKVKESGADGKAKVRATVTFGIGDRPDVLKVAAEHLLHVYPGDTKRMVTNTVEGRLRVVLRTMDLVSEPPDPIALGMKIKAAARGELLNIGVQLDSLVIEEIQLVGGQWEGGD